MTTMRLWAICGCALLMVALADAQISRRQPLESKDAWRAERSSDNNLIDIDVESDTNSIDGGWPQEGSGNGGGGDHSTDDEDFVSSGSGGGDNLPDRSDVDRLPIVNAGRDVVLYMPENRVILCGNASAGDRPIVAFQWEKKNTLLSGDMTNPKADCIHLSGLQIGDYTFTLRVTDSAGKRASADVRVYVKPGLSMDPDTPCLQLKKASSNIYGTFVPRCTADGAYESTQCRGIEGTSKCWCVDLEGREIPGTARDPPASPDCDSGTNLPPCVYMMVKQLRGRMPGASTPRCSLEGFYHPVQCNAVSCYCVHTHSGVKIPNTETSIHNRPLCDGSETPPAETTPVTPQHKVTVPTTQKPAPPVTETTAKVVSAAEKTTRKPQSSQPDMNSPSSAAHIMTQPGILAAIIGGSVVLLLCAVLLVMFVVYRMRKKDEGSYALDETKKMPNYSYQRAPDKEFYA